MELIRVLVSEIVGKEDGPADARWLAEKIVNLRVFADADGKMNRSLLDVGGEVLAVSQFTLYGDCRRTAKPRPIRPASRPSCSCNNTLAEVTLCTTALISVFFSLSSTVNIEADALYQLFVAELQKAVPVACGVFQTDMLVEINNDGPVTLLLDSQKERHLYELKSAHQYIRVVAHWPPRDPNGHAC